MRNAAVAKSGRRRGRNGESRAKSGLLFFLAPSSLSTLSTPRGGIRVTATRDREHEGGDGDCVVGLGVVVVGEQVEWAPCRGEPQSSVFRWRGAKRRTAAMWLAEPAKWRVRSPQETRGSRRHLPSAGEFSAGSANFARWTVSRLRRFFAAKGFLCPLENFCRFVCFSSFRTICPSDPGLSC